MDSIQTIVHGVQICLSAYSLYHAYVSITNLRQYEQKSEKAAQWSQTAADQLHRTQTTQTSGALAILSSLVASSFLAASPWVKTWTALFMNFANIAVSHGARIHVGNFWDHKAEVPFVTGFNDAIKSTQTFRKYLGYLEVAWLVSSILEVLRIAMR